MNDYHRTQRFARLFIEMAELRQRILNDTLPLMAVVGGNDTLPLMAVVGGKDLSEVVRQAQTLAAGLETWLDKYSLQIVEREG